jgi:hypothetical protein
VSRFAPLVAVLVSRSPAALGDGFSATREVLVGGKPCQVVDFHSGPTKLMCKTPEWGSGDSGWQTVQVVVGGVSSSCSGSCSHRFHSSYAPLIRYMYTPRSGGSSVVSIRGYFRTSGLENPSDVVLKLGDIPCPWVDSSGNAATPESTLPVESSSWMTYDCRKDAAMLEADWYTIDLVAQSPDNRVAGRAYHEANALSIGPKEQLYSHQHYPIVQSVFPRMLSRAGGVNVTIDGSGFAPFSPSATLSANQSGLGTSVLGASNKNFVRVAGVPCRVLEATSTRIVCRVGPQTQTSLDTLISSQTLEAGASSSATTGSVFIPSNDWNAELASLKSQAEDAALLALTLRAATMSPPTSQAELSTVQSSSVLQSVNFTAVSNANSSVSFNASVLLAVYGLRYSEALSSLKAARRTERASSVSQTGSVATASVVVPGPWGARYERFDNIPGSSVSNLEASSSWKSGSPSFVRLLRDTETPSGQGNNHGGVMAAIFFPDVAGHYRFYPEGDDDTQLFLGKPLPANSSSFPSADLRYACSRGSWSELVFLGADQAMYLQVRTKEGSGGDWAKLRVFRQETRWNGGSHSQVRDEIQDITAEVAVVAETQSLYLPDASAAALERGGASSLSALSTSSAASFALELKGSVRFRVTPKGRNTSIETAPVPLDDPSFASTARNAVLDALRVPCVESFAGVKASSPLSVWRVATQDASSTISDSSWGYRNGYTPSSLRVPYCGAYGQHHDLSYASWFESATWTPKAHPWVCMAYRIPPSTMANMLVRINETSWRSVQMTSVARSPSYPFIGSWGILEQGFNDGQWHYECINMYDILVVQYGAKRADATTINGFIFYPPQGDGYVTGQFDTDEFYIGSHPRQLARNATMASFYHDWIDTSAFTPDQEQFVLSTLNVARASNPPAFDGSTASIAPAKLHTRLPWPMGSSDRPGQGIPDSTLNASMPHQRWTLELPAADCDRSSWLDIQPVYSADARLVQHTKGTNGTIALNARSWSLRSPGHAQARITTPGSVSLGGRFQVSFGDSVSRLVSAKASDSELRGELLALGTVGGSVSVSKLEDTCSRQRWRITLTSVPGATPMIKVSNNGLRMTGTDPQVRANRVRDGGIEFNPIPDYFLRAALPRPSTVELTTNGVGAVLGDCHQQWSASCDVSFANEATPVVEGLSPTEGKAGDAIVIRGRRLAPVLASGALVQHNTTAAEDMLRVSLAGLQCVADMSKSNDSAIVCVLSVDRGIVEALEASEHAGGIGVSVWGRGHAVLSANASSLSFTPKIEVGSITPSTSLSIAGGAVVTVRGYGLALPPAISDSVVPPSVSIVVYRDAAQSEVIGEANATVLNASYEHATFVVPPLSLRLIESAMLGQNSSGGGGINASNIATSLPFSVRLSRLGAPGAAGATILWTETTLVPGGEALITTPSVTEVAKAIDNRGNEDPKSNSGRASSKNSLPAVALAKAKSLVEKDRGKAKQKEAPAPPPAPAVVLKRVPSLFLSAGLNVTARVAEVSPQQGSASGGVILTVTGAGFSQCVPRVVFEPIGDDQAPSLECPVLTVQDAQVTCATPTTTGVSRHRVVVKCQQTGAAVVTSLSALRSVASAMVQSRHLAVNQSATNSFSAFVNGSNPLNAPSNASFSWFFAHYDGLRAASPTVDSLLRSSDLAGVPMWIPGVHVAADAVLTFSSAMHTSGVSGPVAFPNGPEAPSAMAANGVSVTGGAVFQVRGLGLMGSGAAQVRAQVLPLPHLPPSTAAPGVIPSGRAWVEADVLTANDTLVQFRLPSLEGAVPDRLSVANALAAQAYFSFEDSDLLSVTTFTSDSRVMFGAARARGAIGQAVNGLLFPFSVNSTIPSMQDLFSIAAVIPGRVGAAPLFSNAALRVQHPSWRRTGNEALSMFHANATLVQGLSYPVLPGMSVPHSTYLNGYAFGVHSLLRLDVGFADWAREAGGVDVILSSDQVVHPAQASIRSSQQAGFGVGINRCGRWEARVGLRRTAVGVSGDALARTQPGATFPGCAAPLWEYEHWCRVAQGFAVAVGPLAVEGRWTSVAATLDALSGHKQLVLSLDGQEVARSNGTAVQVHGSNSGSPSAHFDPLSFCEDVSAVDDPYGCRILLGVTPDDLRLTKSVAKSPTALSAMGVEFDEFGVWDRGMTPEEVAFLHDTAVGVWNAQVRVGTLGGTGNSTTVWAPCASGTCQVAVSAASHSVSVSAAVSPSSVQAGQQVLVSVRPPQFDRVMPLWNELDSRDWSMFAGGVACSEVQVQGPGSDATPMRHWAGAPWTFICRVGGKSQIGSTGVTIRHKWLGDGTVWQGNSQWRAALGARGSALVDVVPKLKMISPFLVSSVGGALLTLSGESFSLNASATTISVRLLRSRGYLPSGAPSSFDKEDVPCSVRTVSSSAVTCILARPAGAPKFFSPTWSAIGSVVMRVDVAGTNWAGASTYVLADEACNQAGSTAAPAFTGSCEVRFGSQTGSSVPALTSVSWDGALRAGETLRLSGTSLSFSGNVSSLTNAFPEVPRVEIVPLTPGVPARLCRITGLSPSQWNCTLPHGLLGKCAVRVVTTLGLASSSSSVPSISLPRESALGQWEPASGGSLTPTDVQAPSAEFFSRLTHMLDHTNSAAMAIPLSGGTLLRVVGEGLGGGHEQERLRFAGALCPIHKYASNATLLECLSRPMPALASGPHAFDMPFGAISRNSLQLSTTQGLIPASPSEAARASAWTHTVLNRAATSPKWTLSGVVPYDNGESWAFASSLASFTVSLPSQCNASILDGLSTSTSRPAAMSTLVDQPRARWLDAVVTARVRTTANSVVGLTVLSRNASSLVLAWIWPHPTAGVCAQIAARSSASLPFSVLASAHVATATAKDTWHSLRVLVNGADVTLTVDGLHHVDATIPSSMQGVLTAASTSPVTAGIVSAGASGARATDLQVRFIGSSQDAQAPKADAELLAGAGVATVAYDFGVGGTTSSLSTTWPVGNDTRWPLRWSATNVPHVVGVYAPAWVDDGDRIALVGYRLARPTNASHATADGVIITIGGSPCLSPRVEGSSGMHRSSSWAVRGELDGQLAALSSTPDAVSTALADSLTGRPAHRLDVVSCTAPPMPAGRHKVRFWTRKGGVAATDASVAPEMARFVSMLSTSSGRDVLRTVDSAAVSVGLWLESAPRSELGSPAGGKAVIVTGWGLPSQDEAALNAGADVGIEVCGLPCTPLTPEAAVRLTGVNATRASIFSPHTSSPSPLTVHRALVCEMKGVQQLDRDAATVHSLRVPLDESVGVMSEVTLWKEKKLFKTASTTIELAPDTTVALRFDFARALVADAAAGKPAASNKTDGSGAPSVTPTVQYGSPIPRGAIIEQAWIEFVTAATGGASNDLNVHIAAFAPSSASEQPSVLWTSGLLSMSDAESAARLWNSSSALAQPRANATRLWRPKPFIASNVAVTTVDVSALVQAVVSSEAWPLSPSMGASPRRGEPSIVGAYTPPPITLLLSAERGNGVDDATAIAEVVQNQAQNAVDKADFTQNDDLFFPNDGLTYDSETGVAPDGTQPDVPERPYRRLYGSLASVDRNDNGDIGLDDVVAPRLFVSYRMPEPAMAAKRWPLGDGTGSGGSVVGAPCTVRMSNYRAAADRDALATDVKPLPTDPLELHAAERHRRLAAAFQVDTSYPGMDSPRLRTGATRGEDAVQTCSGLGRARWVSAAATSTVSASSSFSAPTDPDGVYFAERAIDGKNSTMWLSAAASTTQWLQLDFAVPIAVTEIGIDWWQYNRVPQRWRVLASMDSGVNAARAARDEVDAPPNAANESITWVEVASSSGVPSAFYQASMVVVPHRAMGVDVSQRRGGGVVARRLRLEVSRSRESGSNRHGVREVSVLGCPLRVASSSSLDVVTPAPPVAARRMLRRAAVVASARSSLLPSDAMELARSWSVETASEHTPHHRQLNALLHSADTVEHTESRARMLGIVPPSEHAALRGARMLKQTSSNSPVILSISPARGSTAGGTKVTITGENFPLVVSEADVWIGGRFRCTIQSLTSTKIVCITANPSKAVYGKGIDEMPVCVGLKRSECRKLAKEYAKEGSVSSDLYANAEDDDDDAMIGPASSKGKGSKESIEVSVTGYGNALPAETSAGGVVTYQYIDAWSRNTTWGGEAPPIEGDTVVIPPGHRVLLDVSPPRLFALVVQGTLEFADEADIRLDAHYIIVNGGTFQVGTEANPFQHKAVITLYGHPKQLEIPIYGTKVLAVRHGTLDLHGKPTRIPWTRLLSTAAVGDLSITLETPVDWPVGATIAIAATGFQPAEAETAVIRQVVSGGRTLVLDKPLKFRHIAETISLPRQGVPNGHGASDWTSVDLRAEVSLLSRNLVIQGDEEWSGGWTMFGATVMLHSPGDESLIGRIEDVEFYRVGQAFRLGRYGGPHFHMIGNVKKSYVRRCSVHQSFNRGTVLHGVHNLRVEDNVMHDIMGHAIFVEDAIETGNTVKGNLITRVRGSFAMLNTDLRPAGIWITNPDQDLMDNSVSGSDGYGIWYKSEARVTGVSAATGLGQNVCPQHTPLGKFENNTAHSNRNHGMWIWERFLPRKSPCDPTSAPKTALFRRFISWRNGMSGAATTATSHLIFDGFAMVENNDAGFELAPAQGGVMLGDWGDNRIRNTLIVGAKLWSPSSLTFGVIGPADHGMLFDRVTFAGFENPRAYAMRACSKCEKFTPMGGGWEVRFQKIAWLDQNPNRVFWRWSHESVYVDLDGTFTINAPSRESTSTSAALRSRAKSTILPYSEFVDTAELGKVCQQESGIGSGTSYSGFPGYVCSKVMWRRFSLNGHQPSSLFSKSLRLSMWDAPSTSNNFTAIEHVSIVPFNAKRKTLPNGYVALLPVDTTSSVDLSWKFLPDMSDRVDIERYTFDLGTSLKNELIRIRTFYMRNPDRFEVNGIDKPSENAVVTKKDPLGTWVWDDVRRTVTYAIPYVAPSRSGVRPYTLSTFIKHDCPKGGCVSVPPCDLADRQGKTRSPTWLRWSAAATWEALGWPVGTRPRAGDNVTVPWEFNVILDESPPPLETLVVAGRVRFAEAQELSSTQQAEAQSSGLPYRITLTSMRIIVRHEGRLTAGDRGAPYSNRARIRLVGDRFQDQDGIGKTILPSKTLTSMGTLRLVGKSIPVAKMSLATSAKQGAKLLRVQGDIPAWSVGDDVVITTSSFEPAETEVRTIKSITTGLSGPGNSTESQIELTEALSFDHNVVGQIFPAWGDITLRPLVSLLSRSVQVVGDDLTTTEIDAIVANVAADNLKYKNAGNPTRRRTSPLTVLRATELDQYGCRVHMTREAADECVAYEGNSLLQDVELLRCGHGSFGEFTGAGQAVTVSNLGVLPAPPAAMSVSMESVVARWAYNGGFAVVAGAARSTQGVYLSNCTVHRSVGSAFMITSPKTVLQDNLAAWVVFPGTHNGANDVTNTDMPGGFFIGAKDTVTMQRNVVAGSERVAYHGLLPSCGANSALSSSDPLWNENQAHGVGFGVWMFSAGSGACNEVRGFTISRAWEFGVLVSSPVAAVQVLDTKVIGANAGAVVNLYRPGSSAHLYQDKYVAYRRCLFVGTPLGGSCNAGLGSRPLKRWLWSLSPSVNTPRMGIWMSSFFSDAPLGLNMAPPWEFSGYGALGGRSSTEDVMFARFNDHMSVCGRVDKAVGTTSSSEQVNHPMSFLRTRWFDVDAASRLLVHKPSDSRINTEDCVQSHCQGLKSVIFHDDDGSFLYGRDEAQPAPAPGQPSPGTGDVPFPGSSPPAGRTFTILADSGYTNSHAWGDVLPIPLRLRANGSVLTEANLARRRGVVHDTTECKRRADWGQSGGGAPVACAFSNMKHRLFLLESLDADTETRNLAPVAFLGTGPTGVTHPEDKPEALGRGGNHPTSALQLVNSQMDVTWASGWTGLRRLSSFWAPVATPYHYTVYFQSTNPQTMRFRLLNAAANEGIVLSMWFSNPQQLAVFVGGQRVQDLNWPEGKYRGATNPSYVDQYPATNSVSGTNAYFRLARTIHVTVKGSQPVEIRTLPLVQVSLTMAVSVEAFFDEQAQFVSRLAFVLNIPSNRIRIVRIVPGSTKVDFEIEPDPTLLLVSPGSGGGGSTDPGSPPIEGGGVSGASITAQATQSLAAIQTNIVQMALNGSLQNSLNVSISAMQVVPPPVPRPVPPPPPTTAEEDAVYQAFLQANGGIVTNFEQLQAQSQAALSVATGQGDSGAVTLGRGVFEFSSRVQVASESTPYFTVYRNSGTFGDEPVAVTLVLTSTTAGEIARSIAQDAQAASEGMTAVPATPGVHFSPTAISVSFSRGQASKTVQIPLALLNPYEFPLPALKLQLTSPQGGATLGNVSEATLVINQAFKSWVVIGNVGELVPSLSSCFKGTTDQAGVVVRFIRSTTLAEPISNEATVVYQWQVPDQQRGSVLANPGADFVASPVVLHFAPGQTSLTVELPLVPPLSQQVGSPRINTSEPMYLALVPVGKGQGDAVQAEAGWRNVDADDSQTLSLCVVKPPAPIPSLASPSTGLAMIIGALVGVAVAGLLFTSYVCMRRGGSCKCGTPVIPKKDLQSDHPLTSGGKTFSLSALPTDFASKSPLRSDSGRQIVKLPTNPRGLLDPSEAPAREPMRSLSRTSFAQQRARSNHRRDE